MKTYCYSCKIVDSWDEERDEVPQHMLVKTMIKGKEHQIMLPGCSGKIGNRVSVKIEIEE